MFTHICLWLLPAIAAAAFVWQVILPHCIIIWELSAVYTRSFGQFLRVRAIKKHTVPGSKWNLNRIQQCLACFKFPWFFVYFSFGGLTNGKPKGYSDNFCSILTDALTSTACQQTKSKIAPHNKGAGCECVCVCVCVHVCVCVPYTSSSTARHAAPTHTHTHTHIYEGYGATSCEAKHKPRLNVGFRTLEDPAKIEMLCSQQLLARPMALAGVCQRLNC